MSNSAGNAKNTEEICIRTSRRLANKSPDIKTPYEVPRKNSKKTDAKDTVSQIPKRRSSVGTFDYIYRPPEDQEKLDSFSRYRETGSKSSSGEEFENELNITLEPSEPVSHSTPIARGFKNNNAHHTTQLDSTIEKSTAQILPSPLKPTRKITLRVPIPPPRPRTPSPYKNRKIVSTISVLDTMGDAMPKFDQKLTKDALTLFLRNFDMWLDFKKVADEKLRKSVLSWAIQNPVAQQWFLINNGKIADGTITYENFKDLLLKECPTEGSGESRDIFEILTTKQNSQEKASIFIQKMRYKIGDDFLKYPERDITNSMVKQLQIPIRRYLECRGIPITYEKLVELIRDYEASGPFQEEKAIKQEQTSINFLSSTQPSPFEFQLLSDKINEISAQIKKINTEPEENNKEAQPRNNRYRNQPSTCNYCKKLGHFYRECRTRLFDNRNKNQQQGSINNGRPSYYQSGDGSQTYNRPTYRTGYSPNPAGIQQSGSATNGYHYWKPMNRGNYQGRTN